MRRAAWKDADDHNPHYALHSLSCRDGSRHGGWRSSRSMLTVDRARRIALCLLVLQIAVSTEPYNTAFSGLSDADAVRQTGDLRPQAASIVLWLMLAIVSHLPGALRHPLRAGQVKLPALVLTWTVLSFAWSDNPAATMPKAAALLLTNYAAWRLTALVSARDMFACI